MIRVAGTVILVTLLVLPGSSHAQSARDHIVAGDAARDSNRLEQALRHYEFAIAADSSAYDALWKASLVAVTLGEFNGDIQQRDSLFARAVRYARRAVAADPSDAEGHFCLARALGRTALTVDLRARAHFAVEIHSEARAALAANPNHAGAMHVLGLWHQNIMELGTLERLAARAIPGTEVFGEASWEEAERNLEAAVALDPDVIVHRLDLGRLYAVRGQAEKAREQFRRVLTAPSVDFNDDSYRREAETALSALE